MPGHDETVPASPTVLSEAAASTAIDARPSPVPERYQLVARLGYGGMGVVWQAHDRRLDRTVALKVLHDRFLGSDHQERLAAEARAMARLSHPNVVVVYDVGACGGRTYLTMELVSGQTLSRWMATPRRWQDIVAAFRAAGAGVAAAHAAGIVHRDLKPSNILVGDDGRVRVADFGVADAVTGDLGDSGSAVDTASRSGTPAYMAPERFAGASADARSDQFSFAASLYEALHGRRPFEASTIAGLAAAMQRPLPAPSRAIPAWLTRVVHRGLAVDPDQRFRSMAAMVTALHGPRRWRWLAAGALAVVVAGAGVAIGVDRRAVSCDALGGPPPWDAAVGQRLAQAAAGSPLPGVAATWRVLDVEIDRYAAGWAAARRDVCRARHVYREDDAATSARREACLDQRSRSLGALIERLATPDAAMVDVAPTAVAALPLVSDCAAAGPLAVATAPAAIDGVARARAAVATGDAVGAAALAAEAVAAARAAGDRVIEVEALRALGQALHDDQPGRAAEALTAAVALAAPLGVPALRIDTWTDMAAAQLRLGQVDAAAGVIAFAEAALEGADPARQARVLTTVAAVHLQQRRPAEAVAGLDRALALAIVHHGPRSPALLAIRQALVTAHRAAGAVEPALALARQQLDEARELGAGHVEVARAQAQIGTLLADHGQLADARAALEAAVDGDGGRDNRHRVTALVALAGVLVELDASAAVHRYRQALALAAALGEPPRTTVTIRYQLARAIADREPGQAERLLREVLGEQLAMLGASHPDVAATRQALAAVVTRRRSPSPGASSPARRP